VVLLLQGGGFMFLLLFQQLALKAEMHAEIQNGSLKLEQIELSLSDYQNALVDDGELSLNDKMYDIKSKVVINDRVLLTVVNDIREENIIQEMKDFLRRTCRNNKSLPERSTQLFLLSYIGASHTGILFSNFCSDLPATDHSILFVNISAEVFTPPPKLIA
jgi:hypothetical protein